MLVFVLNRIGDPLMPCSQTKARKLLASGKAKVVRRTPFTIKLNYGSSGYRQTLTAGMDTGSKTIGTGFITKIDRMEQGLAKDHYIDASVIASSGMPIKVMSNTLMRKYVSKGDYQKTKGIRSEKSIPTGKLFGLRKHDLIKTSKGIGFVKGKRSSGYFAIADINGKVINNSVKIKGAGDLIRLAARKLTIVDWSKEEICSPIPPRTKVRGILGDVG